MEKKTQDEEAPDTRKIVKRNVQDFILDTILLSHLYQKSYMHRDIVNHILSSSKTDFIITISIDGHIKFWKKVYQLIQFVKHFKAHSGIVTSCGFSKNHNFLATVSIDKTIKLFDVLNTDLIAIVKLTFVPILCQFVPEISEQHLICIGEEKSQKLYFIKPLESETIIKEFKIHNYPVKFLKTSWKHKICVSVDQKAMINIWDPFTLDFPQHGLTYRHKIDTDFILPFKVNKYLQRQKIPVFINISPQSNYFLLCCKITQIMVFKIETGKLVFELQEQFRSKDVNENELEKKLSIEKEIQLTKEHLGTWSAEFDQSEILIIVPTWIGIKIYNMEKNQLVKVLGRKEVNQRFMKISFYQGKIMKNPNGSNNRQGLKKATDHTLYCTSFKKNRFYIFSKRQPQYIEGNYNRDILNQKPTKQQSQALSKKAKDSEPSQVVLMTTMGDIYVHLYPQYTPKTCENFTKLAKKGYYNNLIFHRVISGFMIQTGCPVGDGTGGQSIWGDDFQDEIHPALKFNKPFMVAMANAGPNTNGSQFFITVAPTDWLDGKHTIFGKVIKNVQVAMQISRVKTSKVDKPFVPVRIMKIKILQ